MNKAILFAYSVLTLAQAAHAQQADRIYTHAQIWTGDSANPHAEAIALKGNRIVYVGNNYRAYQGKTTRLIDLQGRMVVPGFIDNHTHFLGGGFQLTAVNLHEAKTQQQFITTLKTYVAGLPGSRWVQGGDWDHEAWGGTLPSRLWIDSVSGGHPVFINRYDGHLALANSAALRLAGIDKQTPNPAGGEIDRDPATGEPTGIVRDAALRLFDKVIPPPTGPMLDEYLVQAQAHALSLGVTGVCDMGSYGGWPDLETYRRAAAVGQLTLRVYSFVPTATWARLAAYVRQNGRGDARLHWGGVKGFVDGSLGSTTAWLYQPYLDAPGQTGLQVTDTTLLRNWIVRADSAGLQVTTHAIGDRANDWLLGVYQNAEARNGPRDRRFRTEHAQHLTPQAISRFAALGVIASMQPYNLVDDGQWNGKRLDSTRLKHAYAFRSLLDARARVTFGTDWTVAPLNPLLGIYAAVTRRTADGRNPAGWYPEQKITVAEALRCYTAGSAYANFQEKQVGMLRAGMLADFVVLTENLFEIAPEKIPEVQVVLTVLDGKEVYRK